jgi:hypothetical protein
MRRVLCLALPFVTGLLALATARPAWGLVVAPPPPIPERVSRADCLVVGKIIALEGAEVLALPVRDATKKLTYRIAVLKVIEIIKGVKGQETLRIAFPAAPEAKPGGLVIRPTGPRFGTAFKVGQEGLFYLTRHFQESFFTTPNYYDFVSGEHPSFSQEVDLARYALRLGDNLAAGLESPELQERFYAAALLIQRYRTFRSGSGRTVPVAARESKQILTALAEADWKQPGPITPLTLFIQLGVGKEDGWKYPATTAAVEEYHRAAQAWLREHAAIYRIRRIVDGAAAESQPSKK